LRTAIWIDAYYSRVELSLKYVIRHDNPGNSLYLFKFMQNLERDCMVCTLH